MASPNGVAATPPAPHAAEEPHTHVPQDSAEKKRKREDEESPDHSLFDHAQTQRDILDILQRRDSSPSFLETTIDANHQGKPSPKKAKLSDVPSAADTISAKLSTGAYASLRELQKDSEHVSERLLASVRDQAKEREGTSAGRLLVDDLKQMQKIRAFSLAISDVAEQQSMYESAHQQEQSDGTSVDRDGAAKAGATRDQNGMVLTLFGNAPTPRQLFSSQQHSSASRDGRAVKTELPVEEISLPNGLAATKIMSVQNQPSKGPTFEESFAPTHGQQTLLPPKSHRRSTTRDDTINWKFKDQSSFRNRKGGYTVQSLTVGEWLGHGGVDGKEDPTSPREKRKQRDRALSGSESTQPPLSKDTQAEALAREEEALFRRAYSSFAPSCDNSKSIVPEATKNMMWWEKVGHKRYSDSFALDPALMDDSAGPIDDSLASLNDWTPNEDDLEKVIEDLDDLTQDGHSVEPVSSKTDVGYVLSEISKLLETLASHQRIRTASLPSATTASRTPMSPAPFLASRVGKPDTPAEDETATYHALRREIAYLVLRLPPYAVAKLGGDQLSELGVRSLIPFENKNVKGTMEEDQVARLAKHNAQATAAGIASLTRPGSTSSQHYSTQRTPAIGQAANTRYGQSTQYNVGRTPVQPQYQRSTSNQSTYGTPGASMPRPNPMGYGQYSRAGAPQANGQQYYGRPAQSAGGGYGGYGQQYGQGTPQPQQRPSTYSQPLAQYQQSHAAARNTVAYQSNQGPQPQQAQSPFNRTASPIKPVQGYNQPVQSRQPSQQHYSQPQQQPNSGRTTPANYPSQPHTPVNGYQRPTPQPIAQAPPRAASGTPQPVGPIQAPPPQPQQALSNGHP